MCTRGDQLKCFSSPIFHFLFYFLYDDLDVMGRASDYKFDDKLLGISSLIPPSIPVALQSQTVVREPRRWGRWELFGNKLRACNCYKVIDDVLFSMKSGTMSILHMPIKIFLTKAQLSKWAF
jgi:hypothetical protein